MYLIIIVGGFSGEALIRGRLIVDGNATLTAANIHAMEPLWRASIALEFFMLLCTVVLARILFLLLRPVSRDLAWLAMFFNLVCIAVEAVNELQLVAALLPLGSSAYLRAFQPDQLHAMTSMALRSYDYGFGASLLFFGCECIVIGYLIYKSTYVPTLIGLLMALAGGCYLINSFALIMSPHLANQLFPLILLPALLGELSLCLWLLFKGIRTESWPPDAVTARRNTPAPAFGH